MATATERRAIDLYDWLQLQPGQQATLVEMQAEFGWGTNLTRRVINDLREILAGENQNLPCFPQGQYDPWVYRLVDNYADARSWLINRVDDSETRVGTINNVVSSIVNATAVGTYAGDRARLINLHLTRLQEDMVNLKRTYLT